MCSFLSKFVIVSILILKNLSCPHREKGKRALEREKEKINEKESKDR